MSMPRVRVWGSNSSLRDPATGRRYDAGYYWPRASFKDAFRAIKKLGEDPDRTDMVEEFLAHTGSAGYRKVFRKVMADPTGRRILVERRNLLDVLEDRDWLAQLPEGTLGRDYHDWTSARGYTATGIAEVIDREPRTFPSEAHVFTARVTDMHDLWHVLGGWGSDLYGEMHLLGLSYAQLRNPGWLIMGMLFNLSLVTAGRFDGVRYFARAWRVGSSARLLAAVDWEHMLTLPTTEVRRLLRMPRPRGYRKLRRDEWRRLQKRSLFLGVANRVLH